MNCGNFLKVLYQTFIEKKSDCHGFQVDWRAHKGQPDISIDCQGNRHFDDDLSVNHLCGVDIKLGILYGYIWGFHRCCSQFTSNRCDCVIEYTKVVISMNY